MPNERNNLTRFEWWTCDFRLPVPFCADQITDNVQKRSPFGTFLMKGVYLVRNQHLTADQIGRNLVSLEKGYAINLVSGERKRRFCAHGPSFHLPPSWRQ